ncbi:MAG: hypothetical protein ACYCY8_12825 [Burkholderiales bacterium]
MKADAINFEDRAVAFLDILGFKTFIQKAEVNGSDENRKLCDLKAVIEAELDVSEFHINLKPTCTYISDSVILSAPVCDNDCSGLVGVAIKTIQIAHQLLGMGFLVRGCILVGTAAHDKSNIFGSAYMDAVEAEKKEKAPRILMLKRAAEILNSDARYHHYRFCELSTFLKEGDDWIVDTLNPHSSYIGDNKQDPSRLFEDYKNTIVENLQKFPLGCKVRGKWEWMAGFFNDRLIRYRGDIRNVEKIDLPMPPSPFRQGDADEAPDPDWMAPFNAPVHTVTLNAPSSSDGHCEKS